MAVVDSRRRPGSLRGARAYFSEAKKGLVSNARKIWTLDKFAERFLSILDRSRHIFSVPIFFLDCSTNLSAASF